MDFTMFYLERSDDKGNWTTLMASPHRIGVDDLHGPPDPPGGGASNVSAGSYMNSWPTPGNKSVFAGKQGWQARVRYNDIVIERYGWDKIPENEFDPDTMYLWGWKLVEEKRQAIPFEQLWPMSFVA